MNIIAISDTHSHHEQVKVPDGDVLIFAGDYTGARTTNKQRQKSAAIRFADWFSAHPHAHKLLIAGNHDEALQDHRIRDDILEIFETRRLTYLEDQSVVIDAVTFHGSPWTPRFFDWAFMLDRGEPIRGKWRLIPDSTDVLITHGPPIGILDRVGQRTTGCEALRDELLRIKPQLHIFGHIHEGHGMHRANDTLYINAAVVNVRYEVSNPAMQIEVLSDRVCLQNPGECSDPIF